MTKLLCNYLKCNGFVKINKVKRAIIHVDMDAFFASIEQQRHPELRGRPVVVGGRGDPRARGVVSAASYEARRYGIRSAMPLKEAYRRCPHAVFLPVDFETYEKVSQRVMEILRDFTPLVEPVGLDEAFLDVTGLGDPVEMGKKIKKRIREELGLTASVGIATNKLLAKIASDMEKPDGLTIIRDEDLERKVFPLPVARLVGVGRKTEERLRDLGIRTIGDLAGAPLRTLTGVFGRARGRALKMHALGIDNTPVITHWEPRSMGREMTFERDRREREVLLITLKTLLLDVVKRLKEEGYMGRTVTVKVRYSNFYTTTRSTTLEEATRDFEYLWQAASALLERFDLTRPVRLIGVRVSKLQRG